MLAVAASPSTKDVTHRSGDLNKNIAVWGDVGARLWKRNRALLGETTQNAERQGKEGERLHDVVGGKRSTEELREVMDLIWVR